MRVITKVKAAVRRARARVVDAAEGPYDVGYMVKGTSKSRDITITASSWDDAMRKAKAGIRSGEELYRVSPRDKNAAWAKDTLQPIPVSGDREKDLAIAKHNAGVTRSQDRRAKDGSKFEWECPKCNQVFTGDNRDALEDRAYAHLEHSHKAETTVRIKQVATDTSPVFNLSPVPMPEDEHGRGRYARSWGEDELRPIPMEDAEVTTRRQTNPNPNPRSITSLALPTPVDVSNAYRPRSATELSKSFGKDEFGAGQKIKYQDPRSGKWLPGTVTGPARKVNGFNGVLPVKNDAGQNVDVHYDRVKAADAGYASPEDMAELKAKLAKAEAAIAKVKAAGKNILHYSNLTYERDKLKRMVANYRTNDALTPIGRAKDAAGGTYTMKEVNGKWVVYSADGKKICTYDDKAAAQHCVRLSMPNRIKSAKDAGPLTQKCMNCGMPIYKDMKYDVGQWKHGGTSQAHCSGGPGSSQFPELWPKKATPKAMAKDAGDDQLTKNLALNVSELTKLIAKVRASLDNNDWSSYHVPNVQANLKKLETEKAAVEARLKSMGRAKDFNPSYKYIPHAFNPNIKGSKVCHTCGGPESNPVHRQQGQSRARDGVGRWFEEGGDSYYETPAGRVGGKVEYAPGGRFYAWTSGGLRKGCTTYAEAKAWVERMCGDGRRAVDVLMPIGV